MGLWLVESADEEEPLEQRPTRNYMQIKSLVVQGSAVRVYV